MAQETLYFEMDDYEDGFDPADECMLGNDGQCGAAGSEWCEFECPYRDLAGWQPLPSHPPVLP